MKDELKRSRDESYNLGLQMQKMEKEKKKNLLESEQLTSSILALKKELELKETQLTNCLQENEQQESTEYIDNLKKVLIFVLFFSKFEFPIKKIVYWIKHIGRRSKEKLWKHYWRKFKGKRRECTFKKLGQKFARGNQIIKSENGKLWERKI